ncbi:hypothetical protein MJD09_03280, partial [bacterium]|nr:hypothetical protein [bacterium]
MENEKLFSQYAEIWTLSEPEEVDSPPDIDKGWVSLERRLGSKSPVTRPHMLPLKRSTVGRGRIWADNRWMAAALVLAMLGAGLYLA